MSKPTFKDLYTSDSDDDFIEVSRGKGNTKKNNNNEYDIKPEEVKKLEIEKEIEKTGIDEKSECYVLNKLELEKLGYYKKFNSEWNLWYHHELNNWRVDGYRKIFHVKNIKEFWDLHNNIDCLGGITNQHFFLMRDNILPIWEDSANRNGG